MKTLGVLVASTALLLQVSVAKADVIFNWSFSGAGVSGSGTFTAIADPEINPPPGAYQLTGATGSATIGSTTYSIDSVDTIFGLPDQLVYVGQSYAIDDRGIALYSTGSDASFNIGADLAAAAGHTNFPGYACGYAYCLFGPASGQGDPTGGTNLDQDGNQIFLPVGINLTVTLTSAVPEPSTWAMMVLGFAGVGAMAYRRRKVAALVA